MNDDPWFPGADYDPFPDEVDEFDIPQLMLDCGNPDCIMAGYHYPDECVTVEQMEAYYTEAESR